MIKYILVTGASSGIGKEIAHRFASENHPLLLISRQESKLKILVEELKDQYHVPILSYAVDLSRKEDMAKLMGEVKLYNITIECLINCAGLGDFQTVETQSFAKIEEMFKVNTLAMIYLTQAVLTQSGSSLRHIFFVSSIAAKITTPNAAAYAASKSAISSFANALRMELHDRKIFVTSVNPGPVKTAFFDHSPAMKNYYQKIKRLAIDPETIATKIFQVFKKGKNKRELNLPTWWTVVSMLYLICPSISAMITRKLFNFKEEVS